MKKIHVGTLICALLIPLVVGMISAAISSQGMVAYGSMIKPPLSPPPWVFSVAWTILYLMMGLASYFIFTAQADPITRTTALLLYILQLIMNFFWSIIFFNKSQYLLAFIWLIAMWLLVIACVIRFFSISKRASLLMVPYALWLTFAAYLNMGTYLLNR